MRKPKIAVKDKRRVLLALVAGLGALLVGYGTLRAATGLRLPDRLDRSLPNLVIFAAFAIFLYGRQLAKEEGREEGEAEKGAEPGTALPPGTPVPPEAPAEGGGEADHRG